MATRKKFENGGFTLKTHQMCFSTVHQRNLKTQQSPIILDLRLRRSKTGKSNANHDYILKRKTGVSNSSGFKTFARNFSNIDFFLNILPLKDHELAMSEMLKKWGVTDFVLERTCPEEHLNLSKSGFVSEEDHSCCKSQTIAIRALNGNVLCQIWV